MFFVCVYLCGGRGGEEETNVKHMYVCAVACLITTKKADFSKYWTLSNIQHRLCSLSINKGNINKIAQFQTAAQEVQTGQRKPTRMYICTHNLSHSLTH